MVVHLVCDATKKTAVLKFDNEVAKNQYVRRYKCTFAYVCMYTYTCI